MEKNEFLAELESLLELPQKSLNMKVFLATLSQWDSMAKLTLIVFISEKFNLKISSKQLNNFKTVQDIADFCCV
jgi:acyl carrier protein